MSKFRGLDEGTGLVYTEWFAGEPLPWSATECPECEGIGEVPEVLEVLAPEPLDDGTELRAEWVRAYREARRRGLSPEEAFRAAEAEVWGFEEPPFQGPFLGG
ncbi:hypothetical protein [Thermus islandicus]|uniref:hypothetical protein n=1 Tax=Thermus islandicus TaxID=540988 RepID=UPI0003B5C891|nr:hypothetical protein [Thermus islandicus]